MPGEPRQIASLPGTLSSRREATVLSQLGSLYCRTPRNPGGDIDARELHGIYTQPMVFFFFLFYLLGS